MAFSVRQLLGVFLLTAACLPAPGSGVAFLGVEADQSPLSGRRLAKDIRWLLSAGKDLRLEPQAEIEALYHQGLLSSPVPDAYAVQALGGRLSSEHLAFGRLGKVEVSAQRILWMPWVVRVRFLQVLELRLVEMASGANRMSRDLQAELVLKENSFGSYPQWSETDPVLREKRSEALARKLAAQAAQAIFEALGVEEGGAKQGAGTDTRAPPPAP